VPEPGNPQALNRYAYVLNNPLRYIDPTGRLPEASVSGEPVPYEPPSPPVYPESFLENPEARTLYEQALQLWKEGVTPYTDDDVYAPRPISGVQDRELIDKRLRLTKCLFDLNALWIRHGVYQANDPQDIPRQIWDAAPVGAPFIMAGAVPNAIGRWGEQQVGEQLPVQIGRFRVPGGQRVYDGRFVGAEDAFVEVKTTTRGVIRLDPRIRAQIAFDADMSPKPTWILVNGRPSAGLLNLLQEAGIPWLQLNVPR